MRTAFVKFLNKARITWWNFSEVTYDPSDSTRGQYKLFLILKRKIVLYYFFMFKRYDELLHAKNDPEQGSV